MAAGRPTDYKAAYNKQAEKLCKLGATDKEMADFFGVVESTLNLWKLTHPKFSESIKRGKIQADSNVADALYRRAIGYNYNEVTFEKVDTKEAFEGESDEAITTEVFKKKVIKKMLPGDVAAQNIWLKNRRGKVDKDALRWADKQEHALTDPEGNAVQIIQLPSNGRESTSPGTTAGVSGENPQL